MNITGKAKTILTNCLISALVLSVLLSSSAFAGFRGRDVSNQVKKAKKAIILVGDSTTWHKSMYASSKVRKNYYFVYANGRGILDLKNNYGGFKTDLVKAMKKYPKATVVFMLGSNQNYESTDEERLRVYDSFINNKAYRKHRFVVSTLAKTTISRGPNANSRVKAFNRKIRSHYAGSGKVRVYDLYAYLDPRIHTKKDTRSGDGIHYKNGTYTGILKNLRKAVG